MLDLAKCEYQAKYLSDPRCLHVTVAHVTRSFGTDAIETVDCFKTSSDPLESWLDSPFR